MRTERERTDAFVTSLRAELNQVASLRTRVEHLSSDRLPER